MSTGPEASEKTLREKRKKRDFRAEDYPDREHGTRAMYVAGCRCEACKAANAAYQRLYSKPKPIETYTRHGTRTTYTKGCRCGECRKANRVYMQGYSKVKNPHQPGVCGTLAQYRRGCRCEPCRAASRKARKQWWANQRALKIAERVAWLKGLR